VIFLKFVLEENKKEVLGQKLGYDNLVCGWIARASMSIKLDAFQNYAFAFSLPSIRLYAFNNIPMFLVLCFFD